MRNLRLREVKKPTKGHTAKKWEMYKSNGEPSSSVSALKITLPMASLNSALWHRGDHPGTQLKQPGTSHLPPWHLPFPSPPWGQAWQLPTSLGMLRGPHEPYSKEVLEIVEQRIGNSETLIGPNRGLTRSSHHKARAVQADAGSNWFLSLEKLFLTRHIFWLWRLFSFKLILSYSFYPGFKVWEVAFI